MIEGIDVSNNNGTVNWSAVAGFGYQFGIAKASEGTGFTDSFFPANWQGMKAAGLVRGAYHFARPDVSAAADEAAHFLNCVQAAGGLQPGDGLALDLEVGDGDLRAWAEAWVTAVHDAVGFWPLFYSSPSFIAEHNLAGSAVLAQCGLWLASWSSTAPSAPAGWSFWAVWQRSGTGQVPGVAGACDLDRFNGTADQLRAYGLPQPADPCAAVRQQLADANARIEQLSALVAEVRAAVDDFV